MTCMKNGAHVFFENYGYWVVSDLYRVGDCWIVRWNAESVRYDTPPGNSYLVKFWMGDKVWHRKDLGVTVVPDDYFRTAKD